MSAGAGFPARLRLSPLEVAWGMPIGRDEGTAPLAPDAHEGLSPRGAAERIVLRALQRPPCCVSFSGGRDSSSVLALATHVARREGLTLPVPVTNRFPGMAVADETRWQERVVTHLGIDDWVRRDLTDELEVIGPYAQRVLRAHGVLYPFNAHFHEPLFEAARGGSLVTGFGGDEAFTGVARRRAARVLYRTRHPRISDAPHVALALSPRPVRTAAALAGGPRKRLGWIRPAAAWRATWADAGHAAQDPLRWDRGLREWWWPSRTLQAVHAALRTVGADHDVVVQSPFAEGEYLAANAARYGREGPRGRVSGLRELLGDLLPDDVLTRLTKSSFDPAFYGARSRRFAREWAGTGLDEQLVDPVRLRAEWTGDDVTSRSFLLLQSAWLSGFSGAGRGDGIHDVLGAVHHLVDAPATPDVQDG